MSTGTPTLQALRAVRPGMLFLGLLAAAAVGGYLVYDSGIEDTAGARFGALLLVLSGWVISLCLHEFAHAFTAFIFGDRSVEVRGYLTLNPLKYTHPALSIGLPLLIIMLGGIGFPGGAVYLNTQYFTKRQRSIVALAGPATNALLAVVLLIAVSSVELSEQNGNLLSILSLLALLQITAAVLNLIPIPGLDGYHAIEPYLSWEFRRQAQQFEQWGFLILIVALFIPPINDAFFDLVYWLFSLSGVDDILARYGWSLFLFWR